MAEEKPEGIRGTDILDCISLNTMHVFKQHDAPPKLYFSFCFMALNPDVVLATWWKEKNARFLRLKSIEFNCKQHQLWFGDLEQWPSFPTCTFLWNSCDNRAVASLKHSWAYHSLGRASPSPVVTQNHTQTLRWQGEMEWTFRACFHWGITGHQTTPSKPSF